MSEAVVKRGRGRPRKDSVSKNVNVTDNTKSNVSNETINNNINNETIEHKNIVDETVKQKNIYSYDKPNVEDDDDDLKQFLRQSKKEKKMSNETNTDYTQNDIDEQILHDVENLDKNKPTDDIPEDEFNPLDESVKERGYTGGIGQSTHEKVIGNHEEKIIEEPKYNVGSSSAQIDVDSKLLNPTNQSNQSNNDIPNDTNTNNSNNGGSSNSSSNNSNGESNTTSTNTEKKPVQESENLKELSPKEKREAIEKTTDSILLAYRNYMPLPFVYFSSYNLKKLQKLHDANEIDLQTEVDREGTTFLEHAKDFNNKVEKAFEIGDAEVEALREPLFDVLMEQDIAFTPTQRLIFVFGQLVVSKTMVCVKLVNEKRNATEEMKEIHKEKMDEMRRQHEENIIRKRPRPQQSNNNNVTYTTPSTSQSNDDVEDIKYAKNNKVDSGEDDESTKSAKNDISKEETVNYTEIKDTTPNPSISKTPTLDDVLDVESEEEEDLDKDIDIEPKTDNDIPE